MIFDAELAKARARQSALAEKVDQLRAARAGIVARHERYSRFAAEFESVLAEARAAGVVGSLPTCRTSWWGKKAWVEYADIDPGAHVRVHREREQWAEILARLTRLIEKIDRKLEALHEQQSRVGRWLREKEETWGRLDPAALRGQIREVLLAADELSQLVVGRKVPIRFDTRDGAPLGYVPVHKPKDIGRAVYLSARILAEQPEHLLDYYRALIVHELGHLLLHLKDSAREYRRFRRLMRDRVTRAPHFFDVFNIILDEQLERVLRDTKPDWQRWFNRLDFYARRVLVRELKEFLTTAGRSDPDAVIADLAARRLIKVYPDPRQPFATIQSAELFSEGLGFSRLYGFFATLRHRLPHATVREPWLRECLDLIPKNFKTLDVFEVHTLAVRVYKILVGDVSGTGFVTVAVRRAGGTRDIELPGAWLPGASARGPVVVVRAKRARRKSGGGGTKAPSPPTGSQPDPEGGPPPPPPLPPQLPPPVSTRDRVRPLSKKAEARARRGWRSKPFNGGAWLTEAMSGKGGSGKNEKAKARARKQAAREKAKPRRDKEARATAQSTTSPPKPQPEARPSAKVPNSETRDSDLESAERLASAPTPVWSPPKGGGRNKALDRLVQEVRDEIDGVRREPLTIDRMVPDAAVAADRRNESEDGSFPPLDQIINLRPDRGTNGALARSVRPLVNILRPYLGVADPARVLEEPLTGGRRLLPAALTKHLAYGETRLFADNRMVESDRHAEVFVGVLIDTSASMKTDGRLDRAKRFAALLAECLRECPDVASVFLGFNQNVYRCGDHDEHSVGSLEPTGKTNEAAALDHLGAQFLDVPRRRKAVIVVSDGLPTACSVESVRRVVRRLEHERGARFLHVAVSAEEHPGYRRRADLSGELTSGRVRELGRAVAAILR